MSDDLVKALRAADLLEECERALEDILDYSSRPVITAIAKATLARLRAQEKVDE